MTTTRACMHACSTATVSCGLRLGQFSLWAMFWRECKIINRTPDLPAVSPKIRQQNPGTSASTTDLAPDIRGPGFSPGYPRMPLDICTPDMRPRYPGKPTFRRDYRYITGLAQKKVRCPTKSQRFQQRRKLNEACASVHLLSTHIDSKSYISSKTTTYVPVPPPSCVQLELQIYVMSMHACLYT